MKRHFMTLALSAALALAPLSAMAAGSQPDLAPGPAAGLQKAEGLDWGTTTYVAIGVAVIAIVVIAASGNGGGGNSSASTTSTGP